MKNITGKGGCLDKNLIASYKPSQVQYKIPGSPSSGRRGIFMQVQLDQTNITRANYPTGDNDPFLVHATINKNKITTTSEFYTDEQVKAMEAAAGSTIKCPDGTLMLAFKGDIGKAKENRTRSGQRYIVLIGEDSHGNKHTLKPSAFKHDKNSLTKQRAVTAAAKAAH